MQRVGIGYDVHRLAKGKKLVLGGIEIPYEMGLDGHSDADVLLHAICDAILGAIGKGDIGDHFPDTDNAYKGISSLVLLKKVKELALKSGYRIVNVDSVVVAEEPNLKVYKEKMRSCIAKELDIDEFSVNIKATTNERMGAIGKKEGIAAHATVLLESK